MNEAVTTILRFEHRVRWRKRFLALQDSLVLMTMIFSVAGTGFVVVLRLRSIPLSPLTTIVGLVSLAVLGAFIRWFITREGKGLASFLIDESLKLEDRIATSHMILARGGPKGALEEALIEDAADRLNGKDVSSIVPFRTRRWYTLLPLSAILFAAAFLIPARSLVVDQAVAADRADIETAGEVLEQTAVEIEQSTPPGTETATLAKEQAEVGRGFRRALTTRSEALRRLSALEERIRQRLDDLKGTRAEEIVNLADRRIGNALANLSTAKRPAVRFDESTTSPADGQAETPTKAGSRETRAGSSAGDNAQATRAGKESKPDDVERTPADKTGQQNAGAAATRSAPQSDQQNERRDTVSDQANRGAANSNESAKTDANHPAKGDAVSDAGDKQKIADATSSNPASTDGTKRPDHNADQSKADDQQAALPAPSAELLKAVPDSLAKQAAKAMPSLSAELLKKAAELRANELTPQDIEKLRKAAEALSGDLTQLAQSKELQKALQEMAKQVRPEQLEEVARELGNQENLKQELNASARLLSENQHAKDMVAGLAGELARVQREKRRLEKNSQVDGKSDNGEVQTRGGDQARGSDQVNGGRGPERLETGDRVAGRGRETSLKGRLQQRSGGEYLYLQSKPGVGAARAPYSSAYPQYRREAERSVQRSQVPPNLRSAVRKYFDAINPDAKRP